MPDASDPVAGRHGDIREAVARLCQDFPGEYWRRLDAERAYPTEFVAALTEAAVILEEIHRQGGNAAACHAQMYVMGTVLRHGSEAQKAAYLPRVADGSLRLQAFGVSTASGRVRSASRCPGPPHLVVAHGRQARPDRMSPSASTCDGQD